VKETAVAVVVDRRNVSWLDVLCTSNVASLLTSFNGKQNEKLWTWTERTKNCLRSNFDPVWFN
jgi:hypothetical protein